MTDMRHMEYLSAVLASDKSVLEDKERTYQGSWKAAGGRSAWFMLRRNMDRLLEMMRHVPFYVSQEHIDTATGLVSVNAADLQRTLHSEDIFARIEEHPGGEDGTVLAVFRDLRRYGLLVEAEMMARGVVATTDNLEQVQVRSISPDFDAVISEGTVHERGRLPRSATDRDRAASRIVYDKCGRRLQVGDPCTMMLSSGDVHEVTVLQFGDYDFVVVSMKDGSRFTAKSAELRFDPTRLRMLDNFYDQIAARLECTTDEARDWWNNNFAGRTLLGLRQAAERRVPRHETETTTRRRVGEVEQSDTVFEREFDAKPPRVSIKCECNSDGVIGTTSLPVIRTEREDDGSLTVVTDYWPVTGGERLVNSAAHGDVKMRPDMRETSKSPWLAAPYGSGAEPAPPRTPDDGGQHAGLAPHVVRADYPVRKDIEQELFNVFWNRRGDMYVLEPHVLSSRIPGVLRGLYNSRGENWTLVPGRIPPDAREFFPRLSREHNMKEHEELQEWQRVLYTWNEDKMKHELAEQNLAWARED